MTPNILDSSSLTIVLMGISLGLVHVLSGPDHLSALAALSNGIPQKAFSLGVRWGLGHAFGICLMTAIIRSIDFNYTNNDAQVVIDCLVAFVMIAFGVYGIYQAINRYRKMKKRNKEKRIASYLEELSKEVTRDQQKTINDYDNTQIVLDIDFNSNCLLKSILAQTDEIPTIGSQNSSPKVGSPDNKLVVLNKPPEEEYPNLHLPKVAKMIHKMKEKKRRKKLQQQQLALSSPTQPDPILSPVSDIEEGNRSGSSISDFMSISDDDSVKKILEISKPKIQYFQMTGKNVNFSETISSSMTNDSSVSSSPSHGRQEDHQHDVIDLSSFTSFYTVCITGLNQCFTVDIYNHETQKSAAFFIGILHGASGPGVFLGLLPAIKLSQLSASILYLVTFTVSSTLSMGLFALTYTSVAKSISRRVGTDRVELFISLSSALLSISFGLFWLLTTILFPYSPFNFNNHV